MFRVREDSLLRKMLRNFVETEMIPVEKKRMANGKVSQEISSPLRSKLFAEGYLGNGIGDLESLSAYSSLVVYEELHRSLIGFLGAGVVDGSEPMNLVSSDWSSDTLKEGVYPVTNVTWCETIPVENGVVVSGSFSAIGDENCQWYWIDSKQVLINRSSPGVRVLTREGIGILDVSEVHLDKVHGQKINSNKDLNSEKNPQLVFMYLQLAAGAIGSSLRAIEEAVEFTKTRVTFGKPLSDRQAIQWKLADASVTVQGARLSLYESAVSLEQDPSNENLQAIAKLSAADAVQVAISIFDDIIQIFGGKGYSQYFWIEESFRNLLGYQAILNSSEVYKAVGERIKHQKKLFSNLAEMK
ncbi:hypothetical protein J2Y03_000751 [Neobacillus niacini]|uniref:acyl-CoA dehydrogenase family protein n=1 Tax=Neobacillus niacini TaxID=86668 RepID=UPI00285EB913|nr:acyl-CoA dehydrogenase family protein [Neobacillus niacini]MDR7075763.1 hypothetical protein [Neobacillus niacini]